MENRVSWLPLWQRASETGRILQDSLRDSLRDSWWVLHRNFRSQNSNERWLHWALLASGTRQRTLTSGAHDWKLGLLLSFSHQLWPFWSCSFWTTRTHWSRQLITCDWSDPNRCRTLRRGCFMWYVPSSCKCGPWFGYTRLDSNSRFKYLRFIDNILNQNRWIFFSFLFFFVNVAGNVSIRIEIQSWISVNTNGETCAAFINRKERGEERESKKEMRDLNGENDDPARCDKIQEEAQRFILARWIRVVEPARHHGPRYLIQDQDVDSATFHSVSFFLQYLKKNQASVPECSVERRIYGEADRQSICHLQFWWDFKSLNFSLRLVSSDFNHKLYPNSIKLNHDHRSWSIYHYLQESKLWK